MEGIDLAPTGITLQWTPAQDNVAVAGYRIYFLKAPGETLLFDQVSGNVLTYRLSCLAPSTAYTFKIEAGDSSQNWTTTGPTATISTPWSAQPCDLQTYRTSVAPDGNPLFYNEGPGLTGGPALSSDGRYVAFRSDADNLVAGRHYNGDIYLHDRESGTTTLVSLSSGGVPGDDGTSNLEAPAISADGRVIAFSSLANNLADQDNNLLADIFVHDRVSRTTERVSLSTSREEANAASGFPSLSADGRYVAFESNASNLVSGDTNGPEGTDVFVHDRATHETARVSVSSGGAEAFAPSFSPAISGDGKFVAFVSSAQNLVSGKTNMCIYYDWLGNPIVISCADVFVHNRETRETVRVSLTAGGSESNGSSFKPAISHDGRFVAFASDAATLVSGDTNAKTDIFVKDTVSGRISRVSVSSSGQEANDHSYTPAISANGRMIAFASAATNLVPGDNNGKIDIFVHDRLTGNTRRVNTCSCADEANDEAMDPAISPDGWTVAFASPASNLLRNLADTNRATDIFVHDFTQVACAKRVD